MVSNDGTSFVGMIFTWKFDRDSLKKFLEVYPELKNKMSIEKDGLTEYSRTLCVVCHLG